MWQLRTREKHDRSTAHELARCTVNFFSSIVRNMKEERARKKEKEDEGLGEGV